MAVAAAAVGMGSTRFAERTTVAAAGEAIARFEMVKLVLVRSVSWGRTMSDANWVENMRVPAAVAQEVGAMSRLMTHEVEVGMVQQTPGSPYLPVDAASAVRTARVEVALVQAPGEMHFLGLPEATKRTNRAPKMDMSYSADASDRAGTLRSVLWASAQDPAPSTVFGMAVQKLEVVDTVDFGRIDKWERMAVWGEEVGREYEMAVDIGEKMSSKVQESDSTEGKSWRVPGRAHDYKVHEWEN